MKLTVDPETYDEVSKKAKEFGVKDLGTFLLKAIFERVKKGRDLTDTEYKGLHESMGEGFDEYRKGTLIPALDKVDDNLDKVLKPFGLKIDREKGKK